MNDTDQVAGDKVNCQAGSVSHGKVTHQKRHVDAHHFGHITSLIAGICGWRGDQFLLEIGCNGNNDCQLGNFEGG